ncbi:MAG: hypothetical protein IJC46_08425 [Clostridia bacterium]|nr:hypothetical protein [Clostridia bacterium]
MKKLTALFLALLLLLGAIPTQAQTLQIDSFDLPTLYDGASTETLEQRLDLKQLQAYLIQGLQSCPEALDVSAFNLPYTTAVKEALKSLIWYETPELFHVVGLSFAYWDNSLLQIRPSYCYTADEYRQYFAAADAAADAMVADLDGLGDPEKALLLHDRLALKCTYDERLYTDGTVPMSSRNIYGALVQGNAVCQGYTNAYLYLLKKVGIESDSCLSATLNHAWNIVYIDGKAYHVDVTWDDPRHDITGRVKHTNFLLSSEKMAESHVASDYDTTPADTTYDSAFWQVSDAAFTLLDNELYYIDSTAQTLNRYADQSVLLEVSDIWYADASHYWPINSTRLATDGEALYFNSTDTVYRYLPDGTEAEAVWQPDRSAGDYFSIYGFDYTDGTLICDLNSSPNFTAETKETYQQRTAYTYVPAPIYTSADVVDLLQYLNGDCEAPDLDLNGDGRLSLVDVLRLLKMLVA